MARESDFSGVGTLGSFMQQAFQCECWGVYMHMDVQTGSSAFLLCANVNHKMAFICME